MRDTVVAAFFFFFCQQKRNGMETKRKRSINGVFETRFEFFPKHFNVWPVKFQKRFPIKRVFLSKNVLRNVLTFSQ